MIRFLLPPVIGGTASALVFVYGTTSVFMAMPVGIAVMSALMIVLRRRTSETGHGKQAPGDEK